MHVLVFHVVFLTQFSDWRLDTLGVIFRDDIV
jgi:hypothetical protein